MFFRKKPSLIEISLRNPENVTLFTREMISNINRYTNQGVHGATAKYMGDIKAIDYKKAPQIKNLQVASANPYLIRLKNAYVNWAMFVFDKNKKIIQENLTSYWEWDEVVLSTKNFKSDFAEKLLKIFGKLLSQDWKFFIRKKIAMRQYSTKVFVKDKNDIQEIEKAIVFADQYWFVFGHFMIDNYARLYFALSQLSNEERKKIKIIMPPKQNFHYTDRNSLHNGFIESSLQALGIREDQKIYMQEHVVLKIKDMILPSPIRCHPVIKESIQALKNYYKDDNLYEGDEKIERVYISRRKLNKRRVVNEEALENLLVKYGFKVVVIEDHDFKTQINLLKNVKFLIALESSSLVNIIFCNSPRYLVFAVKDMIPVHMSLVTVADNKFYYQFCEPESRENFNWYTSDIVVDLEELEENLSKFLSDN